jgi:hypothetical protein
MRLALLERDVETAMQLVEGVKFVADEANRAHARIDRLGDAVTSNHEDVVELRGYIEAVERRREVATAELKRDLLAALADVKEDVGEVKGQVIRLDDRMGQSTAARITARGTVTVAALTGFAGLLTLLVGRALGVGA